MGKSWKNAGKIANAQKKGALFTKLAREIQVSARMGGPDPEMNARLKMAVDAARAQSCPRDTIERAIQKGSGQLDDASAIEELTYEGFGPHGVGIIVECQTDNRNRTITEIRNIFKKHGGSIGESGSVAWMFERVGLVEGKKEDVADPEEVAIEVGANEVEKNSDEGSHSFYGAPEDLDEIRKNLTEGGWEINVAELSYSPKETTEVTEEQRKDIENLMEALDDNEDSHRVYSSMA